MEDADLPPAMMLLSYHKTSQETLQNNCKIFTPLPKRGRALYHCAERPRLGQVKTLYVLRWCFMGELTRPAPGPASLLWGGAGAVDQYAGVVAGDAERSH